MGSKNRDINIDLLRILSAIAVIGLHVLRANGGEVLVLVYHCCTFAVPMFFLLSGYLLLDRNIGIRYILKKIFGILKIILFWNMVVAFPFIIISILQKNSLSAIFYIFFSKCLSSVLQGESILFQFWYFLALIFVYMIAFSLSLFAKEDNKAKFQVVFILWIISLICSFVFQSQSYIRGYSIQSKITQPFRIWTWLQYFLLGGLLKRYESVWNARRNKKIYLMILVGWTIVGLMIETLGGHLINEQHAEFFYDDLSIICWTVSLFVFIKSLDILNNKWIESLASIIMGIFITHTIIRRIVIHFYEPIGVIGLLVEWVLIAILSIVISFMIKATPILRKTVEV